MAPCEPVRSRFGDGVVLRRNEPWDARLGVAVNWDLRGSGTFPKLLNGGNHTRLGRPVARGMDESTGDRCERGDPRPIRSRGHHGDNVGRPATLDGVGRGRDDPVRDISGCDSVRPGSPDGLRHTDRWGIRRVGVHLAAR